MLGQTSDVAVGIVSLFISLGLYFLPTIVALSRRGPNSGSVTLINLLLGWTVIGWLVALAMAVKPKHPQLPDLPRPPRGAFPRSDHGRKPGLAQSREPEASEIEVNATLPEGEMQASTRATSSAATPPPPAWTVASPVDHEQDPIDYAADLLFEAHARGVIDATTRARLEKLLDERRPRAQVSPRVFGNEDSFGRCQERPPRGRRLDASPEAGSRRGLEMERGRRRPTQESGEECGGNRYRMALV